MERADAAIVVGKSLVYMSLQCTYCERSEVPSLGGIERIWLLEINKNVAFDYQSTSGYIANS